MQVFKFGGASVSTTERIRSVAKLVQRYNKEQLLIVISAMGKTTNALEKVAEAFYSGTKENALQLFNEIKQQHINIATELTGHTVDGLADLFTEAEWLLHDRAVRTYDYYYDQIVPIGELLSTRIVSSYLNEAGVANTWIDIRDVLRTDATFRDAQIDWSFTAEKAASLMEPAFQKKNSIITQGFIGATDENESTTLGREGSDYTAAIFANIFGAEKLTIWKDVPGVMNADPKEYADAQLIKELNYREVIEMAYYGAQVIHPKTIKPLQNKNIPLYVRSFLYPDEEGTVIHNKNVTMLSPIIVYKKAQVLLQLTSKDFSFVSEGLTSEVYRIFEELKFKPNLTQNAAISLLCVVDDHTEKVEAFALTASKHFDVQVTKNLKLLTIRHYNQPLIKELSGKCNIILQQQTPETVQILM